MILESHERNVYSLPIFHVREFDDAKVGGFCKDKTFAGFNGMVGAASVGARYLEPCLASPAYVHGDRIRDGMLGAAKYIKDGILGAAIIGSAAAMGIAYINKAASPK
jgi:hypothetical protein